MITDEIVEAIDKLIEMNQSEEQIRGMNGLREMLCDFSTDEWNEMTDDEKSEWLSNFKTTK